ncbi:unnamed protein product, partial [Coccothraustes coccothraustes]
QLGLSWIPGSAQARLGGNWRALGQDTSHCPRCSSPSVQPGPGHCQGSRAAPAALDTSPDVKSWVTFPKMQISDLTAEGATKSVISWKTPDCQDA